jgi:hypothetical protein
VVTPHTTYFNIHKLHTLPIILINGYYFPKEYQPDGFCDVIHYIFRGIVNEFLYYTTVEPLITDTAGEFKFCPL